MQYENWTYQTIDSKGISILVKLEKSYEEVYFKYTPGPESFVKNGYFVVQWEAEEESIFSAKSLEDILEPFKECTPQDDTPTEIIELERLFDFVEKYTHSEKNLSQANDN